MSYKVFFDSPDHYPKHFYYTEGGSPQLLQSFQEEVESRLGSIEEIHISWYLFNNKKWYEYLKTVAANGIKVNITTIPREGYDPSKPKTLYSLAYKRSTTRSHTKYQLASEIFLDYYKHAPKNLKISFFDHCYLRSSRLKPFSRGRMPYSLHIKSCYIKKKEGYLLFLSSSNMAVRDEVKHESMLMLEDEPHYESTAIAFYQALNRESIPLEQYTAQTDQEEMQVTGKTALLPASNTEKIFFSAPFYHHSNKDLERQIICTISDAKRRIIVCGQHLSAYKYKVPNHYHSQSINNEEPGFLSTILDKAKSGIPVSFLSQTFVSGTAGNSGHRKFREPANKSNFLNFIRDLKGIENIAYYVNSNIHSKFIIVDNLVIYCSFNFTPTQFIYLDKVDINNFDHMPKLRYTGIHSEVGVAVSVDDPIVVSAFEDRINLLKKHKDTTQVL